MSVLLRKQYSTIKKEKLSEQAKSVLKSMYDTTDGFKDLKATRKIKPKFEAFYNKLKESKPEAIVGAKPKSKAAPKKSTDDFKAARARRKPQTGVPKDKKAVDKDATRPAISKRGKRTSKAGNTYYEYRDNRFDKNPSKYPMLEKGGYMAKGGEVSTKLKMLKEKSNGYFPNIEPTKERSYYLWETPKAAKSSFIIESRSVYSDVGSSFYIYDKDYKFLGSVNQLNGFNDVKPLRITKSDVKFEYGGMMADGGMMAEGGFMSNDDIMNEPQYDSAGFSREDDKRIKIYSGNKGKLKEIFNQYKNQKNELRANEVFDNEKMKGKSVFLFVNDDLYDQYIQDEDEEAYADENFGFAKGGMMAKGGGFNQYAEPYGFEEETDSVYEIHHKPEMNPNNPYLIWDKIDGVYIAEFPNRQRALHFIDYKKYGYAKGGYMAKGGETHRLDSIFEDGGEIAEGNLEMAMSNVKAIGHHAQELKSLLNEDTSIEAWVVAKLERAETDLSDVTHYIDGLKGEEVESDTYFADGGSIPNNYEGMHPREVWNAWSLEQKKHFLLDHNTHPYSQVGLKKKDREEIAEDFSYDDLPKNIQLVISDHIEDGQYAKGGELNPKDKLIKELQKLQTQLNSSRLSTYKEGDNSEEEMARQRERKSKLDRFNEILDVLKEYDKKEQGSYMAKGGRLSRKQKQLDLNKNGKLDSQDFKMLRAGRKNARKK